MKRLALIRSGVVYNVIVAPDDFLATCDPQWRAAFDEAVELASTESNCEPGSTWDGRAFTRVVPAPSRGDAERIAELDARIAALESSRTR